MPDVILLVDDQKNVRAYTRAALEDEGFEVLEASSAMQALQVLEDHAGTVHVLLTDVVLTGMDGRQLAERVLAARPEIRVVLMSGYPIELPPGASAVFLAKPYGPDELTAAIRSALGPRQA